MRRSQTKREIVEVRIDVAENRGRNARYLSRSLATATKGITGSVSSHLLLMAVSMPEYMLPPTVASMYAIFIVRKKTALLKWRLAKEKAHTRPVVFSFLSRQALSAIVS